MLLKNSLIIKKHLPLFFSNMNFLSKSRPDLSWNVRQLVFLFVLHPFFATEYILRGARVSLKDVSAPTPNTEADSQYWSIQENRQQRYFSERWQREIQFAGERCTKPEISENLIETNKGALSEVKNSGPIHLMHCTDNIPMKTGLSLPVTKT
jgi:hypothetical protein